MVKGRIQGSGVVQAQGSSRTRSLAFVGLTIAIIAVSAWVTVPLGPIPFTLQMFAITFAIVVLLPREAVAAMAGYLALGALGVPVFSGMRGGIGVLAGPTGGFLWGMLLGVAAASALLYAARARMSARGASGSGTALSGGGATLSGETLQPSRAKAFLRNAGVELAAGVLFTAISYACGMVQYMAIAQVGAGVAFATCCAPFIVVDAVKIVVAVLVADQVRAAVQ